MAMQMSLASNALSGQRLAVSTHSRVQARRSTITQATSRVDK